MLKNNIEILSPYPDGVVHRVKFNPLIAQKPAGFNFCRLQESNEKVSGILINGLKIDLDTNPRLVSLLQKRAQHAVIMLFIPDISNKLIPSLKRWSELVDVLLLPTPEMKDVVQLFTNRSVEVLLDPIDFGFTNSFKKPTDNKKPLKIVWFGYPDSYQKSMIAHEHTLTTLHLEKEIEYHIVTKNKHYGKVQNCIIHQYTPETFPALLQTFDACVLSHVPTDFDVNTYCKSENKAVLAINRGVPVIASKTPAYQRLLTNCGLENYLFTSNSGIVELINKLRSFEERSHYLQLSQEYVLKNYSSQKMVKDWVKIYERTQYMKFKDSIKVI